MTRLFKRAIIYGHRGEGMLGNLKEISDDSLDRSRRAKVNSVFFSGKKGFKLTECHAALFKIW
jgi:hypothetical protein